MTDEHIALLKASIDCPLEFHLLDGTRFLATPLFVYTGPDNPDVFLLPVTLSPEGILTTAKEGQSILLEDILAVAPSSSKHPARIDQA